MSRSFNITEMDKIKELIQQLQLYATSNNYNLMNNNNKEKKNSNLDYHYKNNIEIENENKKNYFLNEEKKK